MTDLQLKFLGSLVEQIGAQMYPSATATVAELISNAWDADARNVWVTIPFGTAWTRDSEIVVLDDGLGMTHEEARDSYLQVGRKRRVVEQTETSPNGRRLHGRKGLGKLAAFGTATILECNTVKAGSTTTFRLDYEHIRKLDPGQDYAVEEAERIDWPIDPESGKRLEHGTRIRLTGLSLRQPLPQPRFITSMARRFAIATSEMRIVINGQTLGRFDVKTQFRFPEDGTPSGVELQVDGEGWATEDLIANGERETVRWWIGFTEKPIDDEGLAGISVLANQKMLQRPFMFERSQGTEGQLGQEYLVGEVQADWLDRGRDIEDDLVLTNRDQLQLEDRRVAHFLSWGRSRLRWALRQRALLRQEVNLKVFDEALMPQGLEDKFTRHELGQFRNVAQRISQLPEVEPSDVRQLVQTVVDGYEDKAVRELIDRVAQEEEPFQSSFWGLVQEFGLIDARRNMSIIQARLSTIDRLREAVRKGHREVPDLHNILKADPWLLDPRWQLLGDEVDVEKLQGLTQLRRQAQSADSGLEIDYLFVLQPRPPAKVDEVLVVEIKRASYPGGAIRKVSVDEVQKFQRYVAAVQDHYSALTTQPRVHGLMIAQDYSEEGNRIRLQLEHLTNPHMEFKTWDRVIEDTENMHLGWLAVSKLRAAKKPGQDAAPLEWT